MEPTSASASSRPRLVVSVGMSVDGRIAHHRGQLWSDEDTAQEAHPPGRQALEDARRSYIENLYHPEANLEGSNSLVRPWDGPLTGLPTDFEEPHDVLYTDFLPKEIVERPGHKKWFTMVDSRGRLGWDLEREDDGWDVLVLVARTTPVEHLAYLRRKGKCYLVAGEERVDLAMALQRMRERLGITCVLSTGGGGLNGALLRAGLIDEIHLVVSPSANGGTGTPTLFEGPPLATGEPPTRLKLLFAHVETDGRLWLRYEVIHDDARQA